MKEGQIVTANGETYRDDPAKSDKPGVASLARESRVVPLEIVEADALSTALG